MDEFNIDKIYNLNVDKLIDDIPLKIKDEIIAKVDKFIKQAIADDRKLFSYFASRDKIIRGASVLWTVKGITDLDDIYYELCKVWNTFRNWSDFTEGRVQ
jgi:hypothetical protein